MTVGIHEIFLSIQGEGLYIGHPAVFIRFIGCNRFCRWCDTQYAWESQSKLLLASHSQASFDEVIEHVKILFKDHPVRPIIVLTGGEPLMHTEPAMLARQIKNIMPNQLVHLETNASILRRDLENFDLITLSPKLSSAGTGKTMQDIITCEALMKVYRQCVQLKLVIDVNNERDFHEAEELYSYALKWKVPAVIFTPVADQQGLNEYGKNFQKLLSGVSHFTLLAEKTQVRFLPQLHKLLGVR